jgi:hypothetical protein
MSLIAKVIALVGVVLLLATLAGLVVRRRWSQWYAFVLYLPVVAAFSLAFVLLPGAWTWQVWYVQTNVLNALRFAVALELAARTFRAFPGARSTLRPVMLVVLVATFIMIAVFPWSAIEYQSFLEELQPRLLNGTVWLFTAIAALILWYRLPVAPFHKSVLLAYVPYLLFELIFLRVFVARSWELPVLGYINQAAYLLLVAYWAYVAWRVDVPSQLRGPGAEGEDDRGSHSLTRLAAG